MERRGDKAVLDKMQELIRNASAAHYVSEYESLKLKLLPLSPTEVAPTTTHSHSNSCTY